MTVADETLQLGVQRRACRDGGQKLFESEHVFCRIHAQLHLMADEPDESELPALDFVEAAKDSTVRIRLEVFSDYISTSLSVIVRHAARLDCAEKSRRKLLLDPEFFFRLAVDN